MHGSQGYVHSEEHEESLVLFAHTVVHPRAVMIHFPDASFANTEKDSLSISASCCEDAKGSQCTKAKVGARGAATVRPHPTGCVSRTSLGSPTAQCLYHASSPRTALSAEDKNELHIQGKTLACCPPGQWPAAMHPDAGLPFCLWDFTCPNYGDTLFVCHESCFRNNVAIQWWYGAHRLERANICGSRGASHNWAMFCVQFLSRPHLCCPLQPSS